MCAVLTLELPSFWPPNKTFDGTAGSHSLAAAGST